MTPRALLTFLLAGALAPATQAESLGCGESASDSSRIAVAGGSITEILYALDADDRIVAVDSTSNFPPSATRLPQIGYVRNLSTEGLLSLSPTLVLGEHDMGPPAILAQLQALDVDVLRILEAFTAAGIAAKVRCVARAIGRPDAGKRLVEAMPVATSIERAANGAPPRGILLLGLRAGAPVAAGRETSGDGLLRMAGAENQLAAMDGWKPISVEAMAAARPDFIVITDRGLREAGGMDALLAHPALRLTPAAQTRRVIAMDGMAMLGFGPRTLTAADELRAALEDVP